MHRELRWTAAGAALAMLGAGACRATRPPAAAPVASAARDAQAPDRDTECPELTDFEADASLRPRVLAIGTTYLRDDDNEFDLRPLAAVPLSGVAGDRFVMSDDLGWLGVAEIVGEVGPLSACYDCPPGHPYRARFVERARRRPVGKVYGLGPTTDPMRQIKRLVPPPEPPTPAGPHGMINIIVTSCEDKLEEPAKGWTEMLAFDTDGDRDADVDVRMMSCPTDRDPYTSRVIVEYRSRLGRDRIVVARERADQLIDARERLCDAGRR